MNRRAAGACRRYARTTLRLLGPLDECMQYNETATALVSVKSPRPHDCWSYQVSRLLFTMSVIRTDCVIAVGKDRTARVGDTSGVPVLGSCHGLASARSGCATLPLHQVRQMLTRVERVMHTKRYTTGTRIVSSREPQVRRAPWSGMRPTFVLPLKLGAQT